MNGDDERSGPGLPLPRLDDADGRLATLWEKALGIREEPREGVDPGSVLLLGARPPEEADLPGPLGGLRTSRGTFTRWPQREGGPWDVVVVRVGDSGSDDSELWQHLAGSVSASTRVVLLGWLGDRAFSDATTLPVSLQRLLAAWSGGGFRLQRRHDLTEHLTSPPPGGAPGRVTCELLELRHDGHHVRDVREEDLPALLDLFATAFHHRRGLDHWRWKYERNPWGQHRVSIVESPAGEVVGQYCAYPVPLWDAVAGEPRLCHQVGDTMTAPSVRSVGRGPTSLLARSAHHFYARHCEHSIELNFGFNTGNIQKFSRRFVGALPVWDAPYLERSLTEALPRLTSWRRFVSPFRVKAVGLDDFDDRIAARLDALFDEVAPHYGLLVERRARYLRWRYLECPDADYRLYLAWRGRRLVGFGVFRRREPEGDRPSRLVWGDALVRPADRDCAVELVRRAAQDLPAERLVAWFSRVPTWWQDTLAHLALERRPEPDDLGMVVVPFCWSDPVERLQRELYCTMGDGDLF